MKSDTIGLRLIQGNPEHHRTVNLVTFHAGGRFFQSRSVPLLLLGSKRPSSRFRLAPHMRVIAGSAGGIRLKIPAHDLRPTMDMVREAAFSALADLVTGSRVLDLFAGSGAYGIEALSRGAAEAGFGDDHPKSMEAIRWNLSKTKLIGKVVR